MRKWTFIAIFFALGCSDTKEVSSGVLSEKKSIEIKEYITKQVNERQSVDLKKVYGTNLRGLKLTGANLSGADMSGMDLSGAELARVDFS